MMRGVGGGGGFFGMGTVDPHKLFNNVFGKSNPFGTPGSNPFDEMMSEFMGGATGGGAGGSKFGFPSDFGAFGGFSSQDKAIERNVELSLEDLYHGCTKKMKISRKVLVADGIKKSSEDKILTIDVKPGWKAGTKVTFPREGDQSAGRIPSDIVFVIREKKHKLFTRDGNDLKYEATISLKQALCGGRIEVPRIDGKPLTVTLNDVVSPRAEKRIPGEGMPVSKQPGKRGDLVIHYDIVFPTKFSDKDITTLKGVLPD
jgi:DnaJ-class molecular chaperone